VEVDRLAVDRDRALVGPMDAGQALDQRRLAGAVVADDRGDLARAAIVAPRSAVTLPKRLTMPCRTRVSGVAVAAVIAGTS
jgi:hypothetical protein